MQYKTLLREAQAAAKAAQDIAAKAGDRGLSREEKAEYDRHYKTATEKKVDADRAKEVEEGHALLKQLSEEDGDAPTHDEYDTTRRGRGAILTPKAWAAKAAKAITGTGGAGGAKGITSGSYSLPAVMVDAVTDPQVARRLLELVPVKPIPENNYGYLQQTVRTNNAAPVADNAVKPTSVFTFEEVEDRARVVAHLSEPFPMRFLADHAEAVRLLQSEMGYGVVTAVEAQVIDGDGLGENLTGVLATTGVTNVAFATDVPTTARKARTALEVKDEVPSAWVFNPADAEALDLLRENGATGDFLALERILGPIPFVVSNAVPAGQALLGDWAQTRLYVREDSRLDVNAGGDELFKRNQVMMRAETRVGFAVLRPQALAVVDLTA